MLSIVMVLSLLAPTSRSAIQNASCSALTASEIEAAIGSKPAHSQPTDMDVGKGQRVLGCTWVIQSPMVQVMLSTGRAPAGATIQQLMAANAGMDALRAQQYTEEKKEFPNMICYSVAPPSTLKDGMYMSSCGTIVKGTVVSIVLMSPSKKLSMDQTKTLLDKAVARQH